MHDEVLEDVRDRPAVEKRLAIIVQQLASLGRTTIVKGCSDTKNRGWRRTPLGGHSGMHYYLWWTPQGSAQARSVSGLPRHSILLRAVRHHDDHRELKAGDLEDYYKLSSKEVADPKKTLRSPWTVGQQDFLRDDSPVRVVYGYPGSGKTMALWRAVESRGGKTLYLTWSSALSDEARARFKAFAPSDASVEAMQFRVFIGGLCGKDLPHVTLKQSRGRLRDAFGWWKISSHLGPWKHDLDAMHAEMRAVLLGRAVPSVMDCTDCGRRLADQAYLDSTQVGQRAAKALLEAVERGGWQRWYGDVFPELAAARTALDRVQAGSIPTGLQGFDRIVVDEAQDLTLLESAVVAEYCRCLASNRQRAPWLVMAFDAGQTVRPSGFNSNRLSDLLTTTLHAPREFPLDRAVRSPSRISDVIREASRLYRLIDKDWRPTDQHSREPAQEVLARLIYVEVREKDAAQKLIRQLEDSDDVAVVCPTSTVPDWVPQDCREVVQTPEEVKGLEYAATCVLDAGELVERIRGNADQKGALELQANRTTIDGLRVAISRATETLVLIDFKPSVDEKLETLKLLGNPEVFTPEDLSEFFRDADLPLDERILVRIRDARSLIDSVPERAWQRAGQALRLLGKPQEATFESDEALQREVCSSVLQVAARRLVATDLPSSERQNVLNTAAQLAVTWGTSDLAEAVARLDEWTSGRTKTPFALFDAALALGPDDRLWLQSALPHSLQSLLRALRDSATDSKWASKYDGDVEDWLELIGYTGDAEARAESLRSKAVVVLIKEKDWSAAKRIYSKLTSPEPQVAGTVLEHSGRFIEAAENFELANKPLDSVRNWRQAGRFDRAVRLAQGQERRDLQWAHDMDQLIARRPRGIPERLTREEVRALNKRLKSAEMPLPKKPKEREGGGGLF